MLYASEESEATGGTSYTELAEVMAGRVPETVAREADKVLIG